MNRLWLNLSFVGFIAAVLTAGMVTHLVNVNRRLERQVATVQTQPAGQTAAAPYQIPQEIVYLANRAGIPLADMVTTHAQIGIGQGARVCDPKYYAACYDPADQTIRIYVATFTNPNQDPTTTLAYEYSHYIWQKLGTSGQAPLKPMLDDWYLKNRARVDVSQANLIKTEGGFGTPAFEDELHSIACTETQDSELAPALLAHCTSFLPNRSVLKNIF